MRTQSNDDFPETLMNIELGVDITQELMLHWDCIEEKELVKTPSSPDYQVLMLAYFAFYFSHKIHIPWIKKCYVSPTQLIMQQDRFYQQYGSFGVVPRSPIVTIINNQFYVHDMNYWYKCNSSTHAILTWMYLIAENHNYKLDNLYSIESFIKAFL